MIRRFRRWPQMQTETAKIQSDSFLRDLRVPCSELFPAKNAAIFHTEHSTSRCGGEV